MSNVINFPPVGISLTKQHCECGYPLYYFLGADDHAYGICERCNLNSPDEITIPFEETQH